MINKLLLKQYMPVFLWSFFKRHKLRYGFFGDYKSWDEARKASVGYDEQSILEKVRHAVLAVQRGEAAYERDSVLFYEREYAWPVISALFLISLENNNFLNVLDFGGSLGSTYFQNKPLLDNIKYLKWNIVEQPSFAECGEKYFSSEQLNFYSDMDSCLEENNVNCLMLSSVLQYLDKPYDFLNQMIEKSIPYVIVDRTGFLHANRDRLTVQKVSPSIYKASYPCWFFDEKKFRACFKNYELVYDFWALDGIIDEHGIKATYKGLVYRKK